MFHREYEAESQALFPRRFNQATQVSLAQETRLIDIFEDQGGTRWEPETPKLGRQGITEESVLDDGIHEVRELGFVHGIQGDRHARPLRLFAGLMDLFGHLAFSDARLSDDEQVLLRARELLGARSHLLDPLASTDNLYHGFHLFMPKSLIL